MSWQVHEYDCILAYTLKNCLWFLHSDHISDLQAPLIQNGVTFLSPTISEISVAAVQSYIFKIPLSSRIAEETHDSRKMYTLSTTEVCTNV